MDLSFAGTGGGGCNCGAQAGMAAAGGSTATFGGKKKKLIKKGKRKIKKRREWQSSFSSQSVRSGGGNGGMMNGGGASVLNAIGGLFGLGGTQATGKGRKLKVQRRPTATSWQNNRKTATSAKAKQTSAIPTSKKKVESPLQKRWKSESQTATKPVGLKTVGITPKIGKKSQVAPSSKVSSVAKPVSSSKTAKPQVRHLANTRFTASAKSATSTSTKTIVPNKLNLGVKNPLAGNGKKYGTKTATKLSYLITTKRPYPNPKRSTLPPLKGGK